MPKLKNWAAKPATIVLMHSAKKRNEFLKAFKNYNVFNFKIDLEGSKVIY